MALTPTQERIMAALLAVSLAANGYLLITYNEEGATVTETSAACDNGRRYDVEALPGGGNGIDASQFDQLVSNWRNSEPPVYYASFSKKGIDTLFAANMQANTLRITCGKDDAGNPTMIASVIRQEQINIECGTNVGYIRSDNVCPSQCD